MKSLSVKLGVINAIMVLIILGYGCPVVNIADAQSTLALQEKCAEGAKKYYHEAIAPYFKSEDKVGILYHYNKKLDRCFIRVFHYGENYNETIYDVYENRLIAAFVASQGIWNVGDKFFSFNKTEWRSELKKFNTLIKPYMED
jgi:hypothetical protein